ncbi:MFS transporter [Isoptericola sp. AK164]|uniref:MFS transporter n=1 Tax=Isoptericola sp. AK164 TaxID=3024246 RepID=UPI0024182A1D|nr:MFS transporter [Isoptericola sp. AK164]
MLIQDEVAHPTRTRRRALAAAVSGHAIEWYEFAVYGVVAAYVAAAVFPADDPEVSLLLVWAGYATAFFVRPVGGLVLAHLGDRHGRKKALFTSVLLMSAVTVAMGLVPGYEAAGLAAPVLFVALRAAQGFAVGGEMSSAVSYTAEHAGPGRQVRTASWLAAGTFGASLAGSLAATALSLVLSTEAMTAWGWRVLFLVTVPLGAIAIVLRARASESPGLADPSPPPRQAARLPVTDALATQRGPMLTFVGIAVLYCIGLSVAFGGHLNEMLLHGLTAPDALVANTATYAGLVVSILLLAPVCERLGIRRTMAAAAAGVAAAFPVLFLCGSSGSLPLAVAGGVVFSVPVGLSATPVYVALAQMFPARVRVTAGALTFNAATAVASLVPAVTLGLRTATGFEHGLALWTALGLAVCVASLTVGTWRQVHDA